jgi:hypothetical protein
MGVGGIGVLLEAGAGVLLEVGACVLVGTGVDVLVEGGTDVSLGVPGGTGAAQADEIRTRAIAALTSQIFFIHNSLLGSSPKKNGFEEYPEAVGLTPNVRVRSQCCRDQDPNKYFCDCTKMRWASTGHVGAKIEEYQENMNRR